MIKKTCKLCNEPRYANTSWCWKHYKDREELKKANKKKAKPKAKEGTIRYEKELQKKLMAKCDRLYQEIGRKMCGHLKDYSCLHHIVRKSQGLNTRYDFENGMPITMKEHCLIHQAQDCKIEADYILSKGKEWFDDLQKRRRVLVTDKTKFLKENLDRLNNLLKEYGN